MSLFCPNGFAFKGEIADPAVAQTFDITGMDDATGVLRVARTIDEGDPFPAEIDVYFADTATGVFVTLYGGYNENVELFKIPSGTTHLTVDGTSGGQFTLTTGQMI